MKDLLTYNDILKYGEATDGELRLTKSFHIEMNDSGESECMLVSAFAAYEGSVAPEISFALLVDGQQEFLYQSHSYVIGKEGEYTQKKWRVPPMFLPQIKTVICINIPDGTVLKIRNMSSRYSAHIKDWNGGVRHNAHLGFYGIAPNNTMPAFELAAKCGFPACIVVPKVTADGVLVCIHDDTINRTARNKNGNPVKEDITVWNLTYEELLQWDFGAYKNEIYKGTKIPLLEDFFVLCSKTGMRPMFSTHPGLTVSQWKQVKDMLVRHGLLHKFHIKSFEIRILQTAYSVFGTEVDGYTWDNEDWNDSKVEEFLASGIDFSNCRAGIEIQAKDYTKEIAKQITDAGLFAAAWNIQRNSSAEYERLISYGVTEFTEDYHCSMGLNW